MSGYGVPGHGLNGNRRRWEQRRKWENRRKWRTGVSVAPHTHEVRKPSLRDRLFNRKTK